ncbi:MAG: hypothetical protein Kow0090_13710 [Myxococcota bacterium]
MNSQNANNNIEKRKRLWGGGWGPFLVVAFVLVAFTLAYSLYVYPHLSRSYGKDIAFNKAMFSAGLEQPIAFSHRLHVSDKEIDCFYCHSFGERSLNAGMPTVEKCLGCHNYIIPEHEEILKLKGYKKSGRELRWARIYYNPDHVYFPHFRHLIAGVECKECHGEVERVDRLNKVTFYMGFCINCHREMGASLDCAACHQ